MGDDEDPVDVRAPARRLVVSVEQTGQEF